jgi:hypothetical protein
MKFSVKRLKLSMPEASWKLLVMYLVVLRHQQKKNGRRLGINKLIGGIVAWHVQQQKEWIREEFFKILKTSICSGTLPGLLAREQLEAIAAAEGPDIPDLVRTGGCGRRSAAPADEKGAVRVDGG